MPDGLPEYGTEGLLPNCKVNLHAAEQAAKSQTHIASWQRLHRTRRLLQPNYKLVSLVGLQGACKLQWDGNRGAVKEPWRLNSTPQSSGLVRPRSEVFAAGRPVQSNLPIIFHTLRFVGQLASVCQGVVVTMQAGGIDELLHKIRTGITE